MPNNLYQQGQKGEMNLKSNQGHSQCSTSKRDPNQEKNFVEFTTIPVTYTELLQSLLRNTLVAICLPNPLQHPNPKNYDANAKYDYYGRAIGHSTKRCLTFKRKVQSLIDAGWLSF